MLFEYIYINFPDIFIFKQPTLLYYVLQYDYTLSYKLMFVKNKFIADSTKICTYTHSRLNTYFRYNMHTYFTHYIYIHSIHYIHIHSIHYIYIHNIHYGVLADYISIITMHYYYSVQIRWFSVWVIMYLVDIQSLQFRNVYMLHHYIHNIHPHT